MPQSVNTVCMPADLPWYAAFGQNFIATVKRVAKLQKFPRILKKACFRYFKATETANLFTEQIRFTCLRTVRNDSRIISLSGAFSISGRSAFMAALFTSVIRGSVVTSC